MHSRRLFLPAAMLVCCMLGHVTAELSSPQWNEGCLCELKPTPAASSSSLAMHTIFGQRYFRKNGRVSRFCPCSVETVQQLNQELIAPLLFPLLNSTYFRYVKLSLERPCPFWDDGHGTCALRDCAVEACSADEERRLDQCSEELGDDQLGDVQRTDVATLGEQAPSWDLAASPWTDQLEVENDGGAEYVDLVDNPEQYTGYSAAAGASRIWDELHTHNSFDDHGADDARNAAAPMAVEQRLFARLLSGLHASVSSHIAIHYLLDRRNGTWGLELDEYARRLGNHPERLHHLHLTYLTVLRALELAASHLSERFAFSTGMPREDARVAREVRALLASHPEWPLTFEEQRAFVGVRCASTLVASAEQMSKLGSSDGTCGGGEEELLAARTHLLGEYRSRLQNISKLMDCVGCGRCRLWGKLQVYGLATALRILYAPDRQLVLHSLQRPDVVALFNLLGRLAHSVEVARVVVPLLGGSPHSKCSPRGCKASEWISGDGDDETSTDPPHASVGPFGAVMGASLFS